MSSVSSLIQRAISEAINEQVLPQNQASLMSGSGRKSQKGWYVPTGRLEYRSEANLNCKAESFSGDEFPRYLTGDVDEDDTHYI